MSRLELLSTIIDLPIVNNHQILSQDALQDAFIMIDRQKISRTEKIEMKRILVLANTPYLIGTPKHTNAKSTNKIKASEITIIHRQ
jgi:16S rRNA A1518/A1519 N6-dimethyltransferase RsmA/KsgA/DIM1 with predicted DNA glycosylase/AP lyase activity